MNQNENPGMRVYHVVVSSTPINRRPQPDGSIPDEVRWSYFVESEAPMGMRLADRIRDMALTDMDLHGRTLCVEKVELMSGPPATSETVDSLKVEAQLRNQNQTLSGIVDTLTTENGTLLTDLGEIRAENQRLDANVTRLNTEYGFLLERNRRLHAQSQGLMQSSSALERDHDEVLLRLTKLENENQQLRYERQLLGQARRTLDEVSEQTASSVIRKRAEDMAQRIVDEIGHPATNEPALGANLRILRDLTADLLQRIDEDRTLDYLVSGERGRDREPVMSKLLDRMAALVAGTQDREVDL